jgi:L-asparagine transporter-like permease
MPPCVQPCQSSLIAVLVQIIFGIGSMVGSGVFVITGYAANALAGPAVILSYIIAGKMPKATLATVTLSGLFI